MQPTTNAISNKPHQSSSRETSALTLVNVIHRRRRVDDPRGDRDDDEALILELERVLGRRHERRGLGHRVGDHVAHSHRSHDVVVRAAGADHNDLLQAGGRRVKEGQECGDAVNDSERVDLVLW